MHNHIKSQNQIKKPAFTNNKQKKAVSQFITEIWEVLTAFTLIFSIATGIIWLGNISSKEKELDFLFIDSGKATFYNLYKKITKLPKNYNANLNPKQRKSISQININTDQYTLNLKQIYEAEQKTRQLHKNYQTRTSRPIKDSDFDILIYDFEKYVSENKIFFENIYLFSETTLKVQKSAYKVAKTNIKNNDKQLNSFQKEIKNLNELEITEQKWLSKIEGWPKEVNSVKESIINSEGLKSPKFSEKITIAEKTYKEIFTPKTNDSNLQKSIENSELKLIQSFENIEQWQTNYVNKDNQIKLDKNIVFIREYEV